MVSDPVPAPISSGPQLRPLAEYLAPRVAQSYGDHLWSLNRARRLARTVGPRSFAYRLLAHPSLPWIRFIGKPLTAVGRRAGGHRTFTAFGTQLEYARWSDHGERRVELPVAQWFLAQHGAPGLRVLEVGNVLGGRVELPRTVLDKYEPGRDIVHADVADYQPPVPIDVIVAISTLEHVGFDEDQVDLDKFARAVRNLHDRCLGEGGWMLVSVPLGYHPEVDRAILSGHFGRGELCILRHSSALGLWTEVAAEDLERTGPPMYPYELHRASAVAFWIVRKGSSPLPAR
jgi:hypothetical protein